MKFAHFAHVWNKAGMAPAQRYQQLWRELQVADEPGWQHRPNIAYSTVVYVDETDDKALQRRAGARAHLKMGHRLQRPVAASSL